MLTMAGNLSLTISLPAWYLPSFTVSFRPFYKRYVDRQEEDDLAGGPGRIVRVTLLK